MKFTEVDYTAVLDTQNADPEIDFTSQINHTNIEIQRYISIRNKITSYN